VLDRTGSPAAIRKREERSRRRAGEAVFRLVLPRDPTIEALLASGLLDEQQALHHRRVENALSLVLQEWAKRWSGNCHSVTAKPPKGA
jgi:hypothetical protein